MGLAISSSAVAAAIAIACSSFETSEVSEDAGLDEPHVDAASPPPVEEAGSQDPPVRRWCADQDATFCDDFDELDASFVPHWSEIEAAQAYTVLERNGLTWRSPPFGLLAEVTQSTDAGELAGRLVKLFPPTNAIEIAFDLYVGHVKYAGDAGAEGRPTELVATPLRVTCSGANVVHYRLTVHASETRTDFRMRIGVGTDERQVTLANRPQRENWRRVFVRLGVKQPMKPVVGLDDPSFDFVPDGEAFPLARDPVSCAVLLGATVGTETSASFRFDNLVIRTL